MATAAVDYWRHELERLRPPPRRLRLSGWKPYWQNEMRSLRLRPGPRRRPTGNEIGRMSPRERIEFLEDRKIGGRVIGFPPKDGRPGVALCWEDAPPSTDAVTRIQVR
jgi:hypothetical protein